MRSKSVLQHNYPRVHGLLVRLRKAVETAPDVVVARALCRALRDPLSNVTIRLDVRAGFFANLSAYVCLLKLLDERGHVARIELNGATYSADGSNWLAHFFTLATPQTEPVPHHRPRIFRVRSFECLGLARVGERLSLAEARSLFNSAVTVREEISTQVDDLFYAHSLDPGTTLGVHYRGTDKSFEAERVPYSTVLAEVHSYVDAHPEVSAILVASDETSFVGYLTSAISTIPVVSPPYAAVGDAHTAPHFMPGLNKVTMGREALVTCLSLARCATILRTSSYLSAWTTVFNPMITTRTINKPFDSLTFPEAEVLRTERAETRT